MKSRWFMKAILIGTAVAALGTQASAQDEPLSRLTVHGFLTQAYGTSFERQFLGLALDDGTADYRLAALQFWYAMSDDDDFVIQFTHERLGESPFGELRPEVQLDWVFYQRKLGSSTVLRIGKVMAPFGLLNEIRNVGTLLPFYRAPETMYGHRAYTSPTLNGAVLVHRVGLGKGWSAEANVFAGGWDWIQFDLETKATTRAAVGTQLWLNTPVPGVRLGLAGRTFEVHGLLGVTGEELPSTQSSTLLGSLEMVLERVSLRSEYSNEWFEVGNMQTRYVQAGVNVTPQLSVLGQAEFLTLHLDFGVPFVPVTTVRMDEDLAVGLRYAMAPNLALKLEGHWYRGYNVEDGQLPDLFTQPPVRARYVIASVSTTF